ncbi:MAG TPA: penicillin acylase family protein [Gemmatimonadales bacterium]|nr:penicillin acylase family protein [Gemmatimonadales bacterium]
MRALIALAIILSASPPARLPAQAPWLDSAKTRLAKIEGELRVPGLDSAVEVRRDRWGLPHIYAKTVRDLFFAQGFVAAQDRLWQIDMWRRIGNGTVSEVLGPDFLERDKFARLLLYRGDMNAEWTSYAPDTRLIVTSFVRGLNAYVALVKDTPPIEYTMLGFKPTPFADDMPLQRMAALSMTGNATTEIERATLMRVLGKERTDQLFPLEPARLIDPAPNVDFAAISPASLGALYDAYRGLNYSRVDGSNNWVVSGKMTATGKPILANDPHRSITNPSLRYLTHLVGPGWNVIGAGEPGVPGVAAGHNERVGFGFTIVGMDQQDIYVERLGRCPNGSSRVCSMGATGWRPIRLIVDTIPVKGDAPRIVRLEFTEHGPIISKDSTGRAYVIRFVGTEPGTAGYLAQLSINRAKDWDTFKAATARWKLPTENLIYADVDGNIGWVAAGLMPLRSWTGMLPVPGDGRYEWKGFLPFSELPMKYNPAEGFIATANHNILPEGYTKPLAYEWAEPSRFHRITEVLKTRKDWTRQDFEKLQHDDLSIPARELVPLLLEACRKAGTSGAALDLISKWDYRMQADAVAPLLYQIWVDSLSSRALSTAVGDKTVELRKGYVSALDLPVVLKKVREPGAAELLTGAFAAAAGVMRDRYGSDPARWPKWGEVHTAPFRHPLARAFDLPEVKRGGGSTVFAAVGANLKSTHGASFREVLDLADWDNSVATNVPGQSGQPGSPFYGNLLPLWDRHEYFPLSYSRGAVEKATAHVLWLRP